jgi:hypothetical protein
MIRALFRPLWNRPWPPAGAILIPLLVVGSLFPAEPPDVSQPRASSVGDESVQPGAGTTHSKREALSFGLVMLAGIILGGAMLLVLVVVWGNRARRLARSPLPPVAKRDELWFLKPKKDSGEDPGNPSESGPESEPRMQ